MVRVAEPEHLGVTVTNTGNTTWPSSGYNRVDLDLHFTTQAGGSAKLAFWLTSQAYSLPGDLAPGSSVTGVWGGLHRPSPAPCSWRPR